MSYEHSRIGTTPPAHKQRKLSGQDLDDIRRRYLDGETAPTLAAEFGVSTSHLRDYLPRRPKLRVVPTAAPQRRPVVSVQPVGWPCRDCVWTERQATTDGRLISWRLECCDLHQHAW